MADDGRKSWDAIKEHYPDEWVALVDYEWPDDRGVPVGGVVYANSPDHAQLIAAQMRLKEAAIVWTGKTQGEMLRAPVRVDHPA